MYLNVNLIEAIVSTSSADGEILGSQVMLKGWQQPIEVREPPETVYGHACGAQRRL